MSKMATQATYNIKGTFCLTHKDASKTTSKRLQTTIYIQKIQVDTRFIKKIWVDTNLSIGGGYSFYLTDPTRQSKTLDWMRDPTDDFLHYHYMF